MKYELSQGEFQKIQDTILQVTNVICGTFIEIHKMNHEINLMRLKSQNMSASKLSFDEEYSEEAINFESYRADKQKTAMTTNITQPVDRFEEPELTEHQQKGKDLFKEMLLFWVENFRIEGAEQPDRTNYMEELVIDGRNAGAIVSYAMAVNGLTVAVWIVVHELIESGEMDLEVHGSSEYVRYLSAHIMQLSCLFLQPLADLFEYPNPLL